MQKTHPTRIRSTPPRHPRIRRRKMPVLQPLPMLRALILLQRRQRTLLHEQTHDRIMQLHNLQKIKRRLGHSARIQMGDTVFRRHNLHQRRAFPGARRTNLPGRNRILERELQRQCQPMRIRIHMRHHVPMHKLINLPT